MSELNFLNEFLQAVQTGDVDRLVKRFVPIFILAGVVLLFLTFLGPIGVVIALATVAFVLYKVFLR